MTKISQKFYEKIETRKRCKGVHCVDLGESFPTHIYLQNLASIQPRTSLLKFEGGGFSAPVILTTKRSENVDTRSSCKLRLDLVLTTEVWTFATKQVDGDCRQTILSQHCLILKVFQSRRFECSRCYQLLSSFC